MTNPTTELAAATLQAEIDALRAEVAEWKRVAAAQAELHGEAEARADRLAEDDAWCAECGAKLENVRPGKHQHPTCSQAALQRPAAVAQPLTDEALLRQVLEVLSRTHQTAMEQAMKARVPECAEFAEIFQDLDFVVAALRDRLGKDMGVF